MQPTRAATSCLCAFVIGALATTTLAGFCAAWPTSATSAPPRFDYVHLADEHWGQYWLESHFGHSRVNWEVVLPSEPRTRGGDVPSWSRSIRILSENLESSSPNERYASLSEYCAGWPFRCFWGATAVTQVSPFGGGRRLDQLSILGPISDEKYLPVGILWGPFLANCVLLGSVFLLVLQLRTAAIRILRRRLRRCPQCGYDNVQHSCSECGWHAS